MGEEVDRIERFVTGLSFWVYDVVLRSGTNVVVRIGFPNQRGELAGGVAWTRRLRSVGVPAARILAVDLEAGHPHVVMERLPGTDLGNVFDQLTAEERSRISHRVVDLQERTGRLPRARGFGYAIGYRSPLWSTWHAVLTASLERSQAWIIDAGVVDPVRVGAVARRLQTMRHSFDDVRPRAFLHDVTTKNVIIHEGMVSGIVDVDTMGFGDPLWTVALMRQSLLSAHRPTDDVEAQCRAFAPASGRSERLDLYTALHALSFLGELGRSFNQSAPAPVDPAHQRHLEDTLDQLVG